MTLVADLALPHLSSEQYEISICSIGLMGAEYVRDSQFTHFIEVRNNEEHRIIAIDNIHAA